MSTLPHQSTTYASVNSWTVPTAVLPCPTCRADVVQENLDGEAVLFDPITGSTFRLNQSALEVWTGCRKGRKLNDLTTDMCSRYDVDEQIARDDVQQMVAMFANHGLLEA